MADFRPASRVDRKIKKGEGVPEVSLEPTVDILAALAADRIDGQTIVGFAAETHDLRQNASGKLTRKGVDVIVANDVSAPGVGFEHDTNAVLMLTASGRESEIGLRDKRAVARALLDLVVEERAGDTR